MADAAERLALLEQQVHRAIALIESLRADNARLAAERAELRDRVETLSKEVARLGAEAEARAQLEADHHRLLEERRALLAQVEAILQALARLEAG